jgi:hypothetical protein
MYERLHLHLRDDARELRSLFADAGYVDLRDGFDCRRHLLILDDDDAYDPDFEDCR